MEELCRSGGGWTRIAYLDMSDSTEECPPEFKLYQSRRVRACGRQSSNSAGCESVKFPSNGINYSEVCGRVVHMGYQYGLPDAILTPTMLMVSVSHMVLLVNIFGHLWLDL